MKAIFLLGMLAQVQQLTIQDAVQTALTRHPAVELAKAQAARGSYGTREARAAQFPQLTLESMVRRYEEPMVVAPLHGFDPTSPPVFDRTLAQGVVSLNYTLFDAGRGDRIRRAQRLAEAAETGVAAAEAAVIRETVAAWLDVRSARELVDAYARQVVALTRERDRAAQMVAQGRAARVALLRAEAALSAAQADALAADAQLSNALNELARLLGRNASEIEPAALPALRVRRSTDSTRAVLLERAQQLNPELRRLRLQRDAAAAERAAARGSWWPRVQAGGRYIEYGSSATSPQGEWDVGAHLSYPLFTGGARGAAIDRAGAEVRAADAEIAAGERRVAEALDRALSALVTAQARVTALTSAVTQSEEVARIEQLALNAGAGVQSDYLTAEANLFRARAALTAARAQEVLARVELARVTGELTVGWVAANLENVQ